MLKSLQFKKIKSFAVFFGSYGEKNLDNYDMLILEAAGYNPDQIGIYKSKGKIMVAYQSIFEAHSGQSYYQNFNENSDFIMNNSRRMKNEEYGTYYLDVSKERVQNIIFDAASKHFENGFDGIFLDTLDGLEYLEIEAEYREKLFLGVAQLIKRIKKEFPDKIIIQNNGFVAAIDYSYEYIDAICFENPPLKNLGSFIWTLSVLEKLKKLMIEDGIFSFVLQEENKDFSPFKSIIMKIMLARYNFLYYKAPRYYK